MEKFFVPEFLSEMSVIYGIISLKEMPVQQADLEKMKKAMDFWGPDGQGKWIESSAGLGNLLLYNTPESVFEKMPFCDPTGNLIFTASARIDNRSELCRLFRITPQEAMKLPDSYFIMRAYQRWGEDCPDHLLGDWSFAVWDKQKQRLFIARDHHGVTALYYHLAKDFFVFSSSLKGILCLKEIEKKVNEYKVSQILVGWNEGGPETCYQNIFRLPPAHTLTLENNKLVTNRYWFLEHTPELRLEREQHYIDLFLDIYTEAVKCRLRSYGPVGATLSGGLDSGSVCALASKELKKKGKRLQAFTAVPLYDTTGLVPPNRIGDEGPLAKIVANHCGFETTFCNAQRISPIEGIEKMLEIQEEPIYAAANAHWMIDLTQKSTKNNISTLLIGQNGNATVSWPNNSMYKNILFKYVRFYFQKLPFVKTFFIFKLKRKLIQIMPKRIYHILNKEFISDLLRYRNQFLLPKTYRFGLLNAGKSTTYSLYENIGRYFRISFVDPTADTRLMNYSISLPKRVYYHQGVYKLLIKNAFYKKIPDTVLFSKKKGKQAADLIKRVGSDFPSQGNIYYYLRLEMAKMFYYEKAME